MNYQVTIETLTPLHIGAGSELLARFDYVSQKGKTYVLNQEAIYAAELERNGAAAQLDKPAGSLLSSENWREGSPFVRYALRGSTSIEQVREQIKDVYGQCYLPGSSLKGTLRTALMAYAIQSGEFTPQASGLGPKAESAAQTWEKAVFGRGPNFDLLRALQVSDSAALPITPSPLELCSARVFTDGDQQPGSPIEIEAVREGVKFQTEIMLDELTLQYGQAAQHPDEAHLLAWGDKLLWLVNLIEIIQQVSRQRIEAELETARAKDFAKSTTFYEQLLAAAANVRGKHMAILQLGWGTGWTGTTVSRALDERLQASIRQKYKLGRPPKSGPDWKPDLEKPFPKSRRLRAIPSSVGDDQPGQPLGWVLLTFTPLSKPSPLWIELSRKAIAAFKPLAIETVKTPPIVVEDVSAPKAPNESPAEVVEPQPKPKPSIPVTQPLTPNFTEVPKVGDRFKGKVSYVAGRELELSIPGLADSVAYAHIAAEDNDSSKKFKVGDTVLCEVLGLHQEKSGRWQVQCRRG